MDKPLISFVVPAYNRIAWISECIESLRKQTIKNIEIIMIMALYKCDECNIEYKSNSGFWKHNKNYHLKKNKKIQIYNK